ncbi:uncharacterized protein V1518DRAFT_409861 [Limtongia smithiae]|uniref:uncharacterized protein n=1 Tax=Limtongia smithiae TaxID=1125753 RepID=UPI0034CF8386
MLLRSLLLPRVAAAARASRRPAAVATFAPFCRTFSVSYTAHSKSPSADHESTLPKDAPLFEWENDLKFFLATLPGATKFYTNADGTTRVPSDAELQNLVKIKTLMIHGAPFTPAVYFSKSAAGQAEYVARLVDEVKRRVPIGELDMPDAVVVDKIPVHDEHGHVDWEVVHAHKAEGWEPLIYYGYIPILAALTLYFMFGHKSTIRDWALEELRLQTEEKYLKDDAEYNSLTPDQQLAKQLIIVDRILAGNYDELISH